MRKEKALMLQYYFYIEKRNKHKREQVYIHIVYNHVQIKIGSGVRLLSSEWDNKRKMAKISQYMSEEHIQNNFVANIQLQRWVLKLECLKKKVLKNPTNKENIIIYLRDLVISDCTPPNIDEMKRSTKADPFVKIDFVEELRRYVRDAGKHNSYNKACDKLREFVDQNKKYSSLKNLATRQGLKDFQNWHIKLRYNGNKQYSAETVNKYVDIIIRIIKEYFVEEVGKLEYTQWLNIQIKPLKNQTDTKGNEIALSDEELWLIYEYKPANEKEEAAKDVLLFLCTVGTRISDVKNMSDGKMLDFAQYKTGKRQRRTIIYPWALEIMQKWEKYPPKITGKKGELTNCMKEVGRKAGIQGEHVQIKHKAGEAKPQEEKYYRYELISTHTGRRTFATLCWLRGMSYTRIAEFTGHSEKQVQQYIKATETDKVVYQEKVHNGDIRQIPHDSVYFGYSSGTSPMMNKPIPTAVQINPLTMSQEDRITNTIDEARAVLAFYNANVDDYIEETSWAKLERMIVRYENEIIEKFGNRIDVNTLKQLFNSTGKLSERKKALHLLYSEICATL